MAEAARRDIVLVVDDTPGNLSFLTDTLDHAGVTVLVATDGTSALSLVDQITPDLILMDAVMPGLDGFETCRRLKQDKQLTHVPVIFMTGLSESWHVVKGLEAGGVDYVTKPIVVDELLARIRVHLANARIAQGSRAALDATGRYLLSTDREGRLQWCTPRAATLLTELFGGTGAQALPADVTTRLARLREGGADAPSASFVEIGARRLELSFVGSTGPAEFLYRLADVSPGREERVLQDAFSLTGREADVLVWISRGKSNREISEILGISHRTVNKHLEQVFEKLGVENRAAATARAVRVANP
ncbi:response regulator transcription factor [Sinimarinibacterium flocculans]|uniref:LuxR family two component transcriptional regulator n=1 Tax=Sinimarinibacterium flocculans TaxID=985250 RepID=A0A318EE96_9GAMM|nr:response regulator transcription factor [Sinimarinibacterium flocculans]PXV70402.1 LuxR family two component transcriptional regulator [Sinimarinibacterium flocculans]